MTDQRYVVLWKVHVVNEQEDSYVTFSRHEVISKREAVSDRVASLTAQRGVTDIEVCALCPITEEDQWR